jgi:hypothetical protein
VKGLFLKAEYEFWSWIRTLVGEENKVLSQNMLNDKFYTPANIKEGTLFQVS